MKRLILTLALAALALTAPGPRSARPVGTELPSDSRVAAIAQGRQLEAAGRERISLDASWKFAFGNAADMDRDFGFGGGEAWAKVTSWGGPVRPGFNDAGWRDVDVPHDWVVELPFVQEPRTSELVSHGFKPVGRAFPETSIGWYRKRFPVAKEDEGRRFLIDFDGVFRDCDVWLNGVLLGRHEGGYAPFGFDATDFVQTGENVLTVRVDATQAEGWFYEGAGIYRHVWLTKTAPVHFPRYGVYLTPRLVGQRAEIRVQTAVTNDSDRAETAALESRILDPGGRAVATIRQPPFRLGAWKSATIPQDASLAGPVLWSLEHPALYRLVSTLRIGTRVVDQVVTRFGIRTIRFDADRGFFLNGTRVQINGTCNHQDHAGVGAAVPDRLQRYRLERLKEMGVNAYRTSHNLPAPEILDACDELGILVMDETRLFNSNDLALEHLRTMVRRDRNHPSVILWSIGNEEPEQGTPRGNRIARTMIRAVKDLDATRPVTYASNSGAYTGVNEVVDVRGFNYNMDQIDRYHKEHPRQPLMGSEIASTVSTRGEYAADKARGYLSAYDRHKPSWGELAQEWVTFFGARPWLAGGFVWTGFDYRGEPTPYEWPCINSHFGILDTCGFPKDLFWYYKSWWTDQPVLHLLPHWNWPGRDGQPIEVWAFTSAEQVRLSLNGRDLGARTVERYGHAEWQVPYEPGRLEAVGYRSGREVSRTAVETTGQPARLTLSADRKEIVGDRQDLAVVTVSAVDDRGRAVPVAASDVAFDVTGPGRIVGVGNGDPSSHEADTFVATPVSQSVEGWKAAPFKDAGARVPTITELEALGGRAVRIDRDARGVPENSTYAYWTAFEVGADRLAVGMTTLNVGQVDDVGRVYLNGRLLGTTDSWERGYAFDAASALAPGKNELIIIVINRGGAGGLGRGVSLFGAGVQPRAHRRLFNGVAQVLVQSTGAPGDITLRATADGLAPASVTVQAVPGTK
jgi:beta-galactosidase